jgi:hypothetical protein
MKYFSVLTLLIVFFNGYKLFGVLPDTDRSIMDLRNKVKQVKAITYQTLASQEDKIIPVKINEEHTNFNVSGYISDLIVVYADSLCEGKYTYNYDQNNIRTGYRFYDPAGRIKAEYNFSWEHYGYIDHRINYTIFEPYGSAYGYCIYYFDKECNLYVMTNTTNDDKEVINKKNDVISTNYSSDGFVCNEKNQDKYDIKQNYYKSKYFNLRKDLDNTNFIKYDLKGNIIESRTNSTFDNIKDIYRYVNGRLIKHITYIGRKISKVHISRYNKEGKLAESLFKNYDLGFNKVKYKYDKKGNDIEITYSKPDKTIDRRLTYVYEYDQEGNWIKRYEYENGKNISIKERIIEYYN